jgi:hypothetical protein
MATRYQSSNQKPYIEGQTIQWPQDTKVVNQKPYVLSVFQFTSSDYYFGILWPLYCLSFNLRFWLLLWCHVAIVLSGKTDNTMATRYQSSKSEAVNWRTDNTMVTRYQSSNVLSVLQFTASDLLLWYLVAIVLSVLQFTASDYYFGRTDNTMATWHQSSNQKRKLKDRQYKGHKIPK